MKKVDRETFTRHLSRIPVHLRTVQVAGSIEYYAGMRLVGVYVRSQPVRRMIPTGEGL